MTPGPLLLAPRSSSRKGVVSRVPGRPRKLPAPVSPVSARPSRREAALRGVAIAGLLASALLTADAVRGGRGFCPLEEACSKARESALGSVLGVPTAFLGLGAFAALFALTVLPSRLARGVRRPAALFAGIAGTVLLGYQALWLGSFCPFCVVADSAGIAAGALVLGRTGWLSAGVPESRRARGLWALAAVLAVAGPMLWPRAVQPAWIPVPAAAWNPVDAVPAAAPSAVHAALPVPLPAEVPQPPSPPTASAPVAENVAPPQRVEIVIEAAPAAEPEPRAVRRLDPLPREPVAVPLAPPASPVPVPVRAPSSAAPAPSAEPRSPVAAVVAPAPAPAPMAARVRIPAPAPVEPAAPVARPAAVPAAAPEVALVEYVNAFCPHCRATHARLERVVAGADVRRYRVYVWGGAATPLWAQACVCAAGFGKEDALFQELLRADDDGPAAVWAAASRAGIDARALWEAVVRGDATERLAEYRRRADASQVHRLPTIDVGSRRLEGDQSEADLTAALHAAQVAARSADAGPSRDAP